MALLDKLLIANRGEIALRIIRSAQQLGIRTVAIYTESEKEAGYVRLADEKLSLGDDDLISTFLNINRIIDIAISTGSTAIHPGYGFLSENPEFARACEEHRLIFVGPGSDTLSLMGNKPEAKELAASLGIPVILSQCIDIQQSSTIRKIGYPVLLKASYGGGGKGMQIVYHPEELIKQAEQSSRMALNYFGNGALFVEQYIRNARHVEVQIIGDIFGNIIHLHERECSIQRNHQKIIEEAPAIFLVPELRNNLFSAALKIGKAVNYTGAGTIEFLIDESGNYFFMEMNPRIQVEHAVTEQVTGIDIVSEQLKIASGLPLSFAQEQVNIRGHAIEIRIYTENPAQEFTPSSLELRSLNLPKHQNLRTEADFDGNHQIRTLFDPLLLKMIAWGEDRNSAINLLKNSIRELNIVGPETNTKYLERILDHTLFQQNNISVEFCKNHHNELIKYSKEKISVTHLPYLIGLAIAKNYLKTDKSTTDPWQYLGYWRLATNNITIAVDDETYPVELNINDKSKPSFVLNGTKVDFKIEYDSEDSIAITIGNITNKIFYHLNIKGDITVSWENIQHRITFHCILKNHPETDSRSDNRSIVETGEITSPIHGKILEIYIKENQFIKKGDPLLVIEAMKSENRILSHKDAKVKKIAVEVGAQVSDRMPLIFLED